MNISVERVLAISNGLLYLADALLWLVLPHHLVQILRRLDLRAAHMRTLVALGLSWSLLNLLLVVPPTTPLRLVLALSAAGIMARCFSLFAPRLYWERLAYESEARPQSRHLYAGASCAFGLVLVIWGLRAS